MDSEKELAKRSLNAKMYQEYCDREALKQAERIIAGTSGKPVLPHVWDKWMEAVEQYDAGRITRERLMEIARGFLLWYDKSLEGSNRLLDDYFFDKPQKKQV